MKILFHNYSNELSTEPIYLTKALHQSGLDAMLWSDPNVSAFDSFDRTKPDVFITHAQTITPDILKYLSQNRSIDLVVNITGLSDGQVMSLEKHILDSNISCPSIFTNSFSHNEKPTTSLKCFRLFPAVDIFNVRRSPAFKACESAVVALRQSEMLQKAIKGKEVYHLIQVTNKDMEDGFDLRTNAISIGQLYGIYKNVMLVGDTDFCSSQLFFDLNYNTDNIKVEVSDRENFNKFLSEAFKNTDADEDIGLQIKGQIANSHTPFHRAATLCKHLKFKDGMIKTERAKDHILKRSEQ